MKKSLILVMALVLAVAMPLFAQEQEMKKPEGMPEMTPPPPLSNDWMKWSVGEWEGTTMSQMGDVKEKHSVQMGLDGQFMLVDVKSKMGDKDYHGMGSITLNPAGEYVGFWIDNFRAMSQGKGTLEGNKLTMSWTMPGMGTYTRVTEKIDADNFKVSATMKMENGMTMDENGSFTRVKMSDK